MEMTDHQKAVVSFVLLTQVVQTLMLLWILIFHDGEVHDHLTYNRVADESMQVKRNQITLDKADQARTRKLLKRIAEALTADDEDEDEDEA